MVTPLMAPRPSVTQSRDQTFEMAKDAEDRPPLDTAPVLQPQCSQDHFGEGGVENRLAFSPQQQKKPILLGRSLQSPARI